MGSPDAELGRSGSEGPQHDVTIGKPFAVGRFAVTADEWKAFSRMQAAMATRPKAMRNCAAATP
jgi:formylglycine-generating enzyme required for sulfatase activity